MEDNIWGIELYWLNDYEKISIRNLKKNGGTLGLTFYEMLGICSKHDRKTRLASIFNDEKVIGYILYYFYDNDKGIHIAHIAIEPEYQRMGFGNQLVKDIMEHYQYDYITADVMYDNEKSKNFFKKLGFNFSPEDEKNRWNVKFYKDKKN